jgi:hypothetical protein
VTFPIPFRPPFAAAGGGVTNVAWGGDQILHTATHRIHVFNQDGTLTVNGGTTARVLIVAGGGGGGAYGGGGGGEVREIASHSLSVGEYQVTVGAGGSGGTTNAAQGGDTTFDSITCNGGGKGGGENNNGGDGGSGGGTNSVGSPGSSVLTASGQGNAGGSVASAGNSGSGGGGATAVGGSCSGATAGAGGEGATSDISGSSDVYGSGGGGGSFNGTAGAGGTNAAAGALYSATPIAAPANFGGGGGGGGLSTTSGSNGGSGVVIVAYETDTSAALEPTDIGGLVAWWDAGSGVTDISTAVTDWEDKIGGIVATDDDTANRRPTLNATGLNSLPTIEFDASTERLDFDTSNMPLGADPRTMFLVGKPNSSGRTTLFSVGVNGTTHYSAFDIEGEAWNQVNKFGVEFVNGRLASSSAYTTPEQFELLSVRYSGGNINPNLTMRFAGEDQGLVFTLSSAPLATDGTFGNIGNVERKASHSSGHAIADIIAFNTDLPTLDLQKLEGWAAHRYGLTADLPASHPFASVAPKRYDASRTFVISTNDMGTGNNPTVSLTDAAEGDMAVVVHFGNGATSMPVGWTKNAYSDPSHQFDIYTKVLTGGDISSPPTLTSSASHKAQFSIILRGDISDATMKTHTHNSSIRNVTIGGFTKAATSRAVLVITARNDAGAPPGATSYGADDWVNIYDDLAMIYRYVSAGFIEASDYTDNADIVITSGYASAGLTDWAVLEII